MSLAVPTSYSLEQFLRLPYIEESPAWEFIYGEAVAQLDVSPTVLAPVLVLNELDLITRMTCRPELTLREN